MEKNPGFTVIEALVSMAILSLLVVVLVSATQFTGDIFQRANDQVESFQAGRAAFADMVREIGQATLNTRWDYDDPNAPTQYRRVSDLQFVSGPDLAGDGHSVFFTAPLATTSDPNLKQVDGLLNPLGFFIEYSDDSLTKPDLDGIEAKSRSRLMRLIGDTKDLSIYSSSDPLNPTEFGWFEDPIADGQAHPIADNVIALIIWPKLSPADDPEGDDLAPDFTWNSRLNADAVPQPETAHQMPPLLEITAVLVSEDSAARYEALNGSTASLADLSNGLFNQAAEFASDLDTLEDRLQATNPPLEYLILSETVQIRENKWGS